MVNMQYMFIYETTNNINGKKYIGQHTTSNMNDGYLGSGKILKQAIDKYGIDNFSRKILCHANNKDQLNELEIYYIDKFNAIESDMYYNIAEGGYGNPRAGFTDEEKEEWRKKMSEALKGREFTEEWKAKIREAHLGKQHSEETKEKISENNARYWQGKQLSDTHKAKLSEHSAKYWQGKQRSEESKQKMSESKQGSNNPNSKPILMIDKHNNPVACFDCVRDANEHIGKPRNMISSIYACAKGYSKTAYKYIWRYIEITLL